QHWSDYFKPG
uniref:Gonadoliberin-1 n=1 Tax=Chelyosoma productum TaxID=71177 RepID=GON1_CHEPR|nr:RecName: Full=Gonadoliberin-1; AltName: Full=Gonadoliberin I; AltName: Full=Gonadotropin-releasing hormone I; Short=GnRH-I; AltName: Full=Luliberin I [Chelyosoma productum]